MLADWFNSNLAIIMGMSLGNLMMMCWFSIAFDWPRYLLSYAPAVIATLAEMRKDVGPMPDIGKVSILIPGHNEADALEQCVLSLREQTFQDFEIVCVSDGSTDATYALMQRLQREGKVDKIAECAVRGGKSSAINLGIRIASGDIVIVIDCDCSFDRTAIEEILRPFADPQMGAVGGSVLVRNGEKSITASLQAIEYMVAIQLGRTALNLVGQLNIISGAFGAFRRTAFMHVGMMDPGPGEDGDITFRLRNYGYKIGFALRSVAYTDVPVHMYNLIMQRKRWERDALWIRFRKHIRMVDPRSAGFNGKELPHVIDYFVTDVLAGFVGVVYLAWLFSVADAGFVLFILFGMYLLFLVLDFFMFACACLATGKRQYWAFWPFMFVYGPWKGYFMRAARLYTYVEEWIYSASRHDNFAPPKVNDWIRWK
jgi:cellulose synthase/poly-beta-1,6-N-acetylglucosamine synthase-like glycosyltransferase